MNKIDTDMLKNIIVWYVAHIQIVFYSFAIIASIIAIFQFRYNIKWNKKQLTITILNGLKDKLEDHFEFLHKTFKYRDINNAIEIKTIHGKMGYFLEDEKKTEDECDKNDVVDISGKKFVYIENGKEVRLKLANFLNDLETFCAGVNEKTFDEKQSKKLMRGVIVKAYKTFAPYIKHLRDDHKDMSNLVYKELLDLGGKWDN